MPIFYFTPDSQTSAIEDYNQALQLIPEDAVKFYSNRGSVRSALGDKEGALEDYNWARILASW